jgi:hypothetical protein
VNRREPGDARLAIIPIGNYRIFILAGAEKIPTRRVIDTLLLIGSFFYIYLISSYSDLLIPLTAAVRLAESSSPTRRNVHILVLHNVMPGLVPLALQWGRFRPASVARNPTRSAASIQITRAVGVVAKFVEMSCPVENIRVPNLATLSYVVLVRSRNSPSVIAATR